MRVDFLPISPGGAARVLPLMAQLYAHEAIEYDEARASRICETLLAGPESGGIWIVQVDGHDAGYLVVTVAASLEFGGRFALLDELYIAAGWRGRGLGPSAVEFAADWARGRGIEALRLEVSEENEHALHVYRKSGFLDPGRRILTKPL